MGSIVIDNNIINCLSKDKNKLERFIKQVNQKRLKIYLVWSLLSEALGHKCKNIFEIRKRFECLKEIKEKCPVEALKSNKDCSLKELKTQGKAKTPAFVRQNIVDDFFANPEHSINHIKNTGEAIENDRANVDDKAVDALSLPEPEYQGYLATMSFFYDKGKSSEELNTLYQSFCEFGFDEKNELHREFIKYSLKKIQKKHIEVCQRPLFKNTKAIINSIFREPEKYKFLRTRIICLFCLGTKWRDEIKSKAFNDENKSGEEAKKDFRKELQRCQWNHGNDLEYIICSSYSDYLITDDRGLSNKCVEIKKVIPFSVKTLNDFLEI